MGAWDYSTYQWNDEGTEGELLDARKTVEYTIHEGGEAKVLEYLFPEYEDCVTCHGPAINDVLGPKTAQINRDRDYDGLVANQLVAMAEIDLLVLDGDEEIEPSVGAENGEPAEGRGHPRRARPVPTSTRTARIVIGPTATRALATTASTFATSSRSKTPECVSR